MLEKKYISHSEHTFTYTQMFRQTDSHAHFSKLSQAQWPCLDSTRGAICSCIGQFEETQTQESLRMQYGSHVNHQPSSFPLKMSHWATGKWGQFVLHNLFKKATFYRPFSEQWDRLWRRFSGIHKIYKKLTFTHYTTPHCNIISPTSFIQVFHKRDLTFYFAFPFELCSNTVKWKCTKGYR